MFCNHTVVMVKQLCEYNKKTVNGTLKKDEYYNFKTVKCI